MLNHTELLAERTALLARIDEMSETLEGCDWCCGGGDQEMEWINGRLSEIEADLAFRGCTGPYPDAPDHGSDCGATHGTCPQHG